MSGDQLLLFDNGTGSNFQQPPGETRTYSAPRKYQIDLGAFEATETWHYYPDPSVYSAFCSSVYEDAPDNYVIDYTLGTNAYTGIVGLDALGNVAFNYRLRTRWLCNGLERDSDPLGGPETGMIRLGFDFLVACPVAFEALTELLPSC